MIFLRLLNFEYLYSLILKKNTNPLLNQTNQLFADLQPIFFIKTACPYSTHIFFLFIRFIFIKRSNLKIDALLIFLLMFFLMVTSKLPINDDLKNDSSELIGLLIFIGLSTFFRISSIFLSVKDHEMISNIFLLTSNCFNIFLIFWSSEVFFKLYKLLSEISLPQYCGTQTTFQLLPDLQEYLYPAPSWRNYLICFFSRELHIQLHLIFPLYRYLQF